METSEGNDQDQLQTWYFRKVNGKGKALLTYQQSLWQSSTLNQAQHIEPVPPASDGAPMESWLGGAHPDGILEITRGFYLYADQLNRLLIHLMASRDADKSLYKQIAQATGMSQAQVKSTIQYTVFMELLMPRSLRVTPLGRLVLQCDPFFDQIGTLWLLHYLLSSNPHLVIWNMMCNTVIPGQVKISKTDAAEQFTYFVGRWTESSIRKKVPKELRAFFAAYSKEFFSQLDLLSETETNVYAIHREAAPIPPLVFLAATLIYRDRYTPGASGIEIPTLAYGEQSPGRLMRQGEMTIRRTLDELHEADWITVESKANLDQVRFRSGPSWLDAMRAHYSAQKEEES